MKNMVICGLGYISNRVAEGCLAAEGMRLYGFQSRSLEKAQAAMGRFGAEAAYGSFEDVLADTAVDCVYLCTPNDMHVDMTRQALCAGKAVICEKPLAPTAKDAWQLFALAAEQGVLLMEAAKTLASPLLLKVRDAVRDGIIGKLSAIEANYCYDMSTVGKESDDWIFGPCGGCALDIGVYPAALACLFAEAPTIDVKIVRRDFGYPVNADMEAFIEYEDGLTAHLCASWLRDVPGKGTATLYGTEGVIEIPMYWKTHEAHVTTGGKTSIISAEFPSDFTPEIESAAAAMEQGLCEVPGMGREETISILVVVAD